METTLNSDSALLCVGIIWAFLYFKSISHGRYLGSGLHSLADSEHRRRYKKSAIPGFILLTISC